MGFRQTFYTLDKGIIYTKDVEVLYSLCSSRNARQATRQKGHTRVLMGNNRIEVNGETDIMTFLIISFRIPFVSIAEYTPT